MAKKRLKIAILVKSFITTGGSERYTVEIARRMRDRGHEIHLFAWGKDDEQSQGMHFYLVPVPNKLNRSGVLNSYSYARESARVLQGKTFDVIHSHERGANQDLLTIHTFSYLGGLYKYSFIRRLDQRFLSFRSRLYLWMEKRQMQSPWLVAVSGVIRKDIEKYYHRKHNVVTIPPGVDADVFHPDWISANRPSQRKDRGIGDKETVVLFVGSEFKRKGLDILIPAIGKEMRLFVVGRGQHLEHYKKLAEDSGARERVYFEGFVGEDVKNYYALADVLVLPSLSDAFGMTVLEAMAYGLPVVVSQAAGASEIISHGEDGFIFAQSAELATILKSLTDEKLRTNIGGNARITAEEYTWERAADRYEEIYYRIAQEKKSNS
ncbi:MAG: glycosyltransferase family 4 protein [Desulfocapsa sp.]|nr:glycosyltransferase family 4 protein [Desulfocapsa sp.]